jgi:hypothetical protein
MLKVVGEVLNKVTATRGEMRGKQINIKHDLSLKSIEKKDLSSGTSIKPGVSFDYLLTVSYGESSGRIDVEGSIFAMGEAKEMDTIITKWAKKEKIDEDLLVPILNRAWQMGYVQAISLAERVRLPTPIRIPRVVTQKQSEKLEKSAKK